MFNVFKKTIRDKRFFILGWSLGLLVLGYFMTILFPSFNEGVVDQLATSLPPALQGFVGQIQNLKELPTYLAGQLFDVRGTILIGVLSILLAVGLTVGEEDKGQLRTLISLPINRTQVIVAKWWAVVVICLIAVIAMVAGVEIGILQIGESIDQTVLLHLGSLTWLMSVALATVIFAIGMASGKRSLTTLVGILVVAGSFILTTFSQSVDWLKDYERLSFFHYFPAIDVAKGTIEGTNILFYLALIIVSLIVAVIFFRRRDVKTA